MEACGGLWKFEIRDELATGAAQTSFILVFYRLIESDLGATILVKVVRLVVIDKLPFDVPSDPLVAARTRRLEEEGRAPFMEYLVPAAAIALKQGFGRLVRSRRDHGIVAVLDRRLTTKGYGKVFLRSLPPAQRCDTREAVEAFWRGLPRATESEPPF